jgi:hypothetical protein
MLPDERTGSDLGRESGAPARVRIIHTQGSSQVRRAERVTAVADPRT